MTRARLLCAAAASTLLLSACSSDSPAQVAVEVLVPEAIAEVVSPAPAAPVAAAAPPVAPGTIRWSGLTWRVRDWAGAPSYNGLWRRDNVAVDQAGRLHLRVTPHAGHPTSAEVEAVQQRGWGYGTYTFEVGSSVASLHDNIVLGLFLTDSKGTELDIEASGWDWPGVNNWDHTVHRKGRAPTVAQFKDVGADRTRHSFTWLPGRLIWVSSRIDTGAVVRETRITDGVPTPGPTAKLSLNLWAFDGDGPGDPRTIPTSTVIIDKFTYRKAVL